MVLAFIGIGKVGFALANGLLGHGHRIIIAHDDPESASVRSALDRNPAFKVAALQAAIDQSDMVFLANPFGMNEGILTALRFKDTVVVDCTNPVGPGLTHGLESRSSGSELVAIWAKGAKVVKAFTIYGFENLDAIDYHTTEKPAMLLAGEVIDAKRSVALLARDLGFEPIDVGPLDQALHLEHMTLLWVKMVRRDGHHPNFTWAYLERKG